MKTVTLIGIGPGDPDALTLAAVRAIQAADLFFLLDKHGDGTESLIRFRQEILDRHRGNRPYRVARMDNPCRDRGAEDYRCAVDDWRTRRGTLIGRMIDESLAEGEHGAFLIWGDPSLYDGTLGNLHALAEAGRVIDIQVVPGITSVQVLAARHCIPLNQIGQGITITTGRQIEQAEPESYGDVVVMLDSRSAFRRWIGTGPVEIFWGADLGGPDEVLIAGPLAEVADRIDAALAAQRARKGWVMDCYLMRRGAD